MQLTEGGIQNTTLVVERLLTDAAFSYSGLLESAGRVEYTALSISVNVSMLVP